MRINRQIRATNVRLIDKNGAQVGVVTIQEAQAKADADNLGRDLIVIRSVITKKERENKQAQHQVKIKEVKVKPNTDDHDLQVKLKRAREFIEKGNKVRITCMFRGREMAHPEVGRKVVKRMLDDLADIATAEAFPKQMGRSLSVTLSPGVKKMKEKKSESKDEVEKSG